MEAVGKLAGGIAQMRSPGVIEWALKLKLVV